MLSSSLSKENDMGLFSAAMGTAAKALGLEAEVNQLKVSAQELSDLKRSNEIARRQHAARMAKLDEESRKRRADMAAEAEAIKKRYEEERRVQEAEQKAIFEKHKKNMAAFDAIMAKMDSEKDKLDDPRYDNEQVIGRMLEITDELQEHISNS